MAGGRIRGDREGRSGTHAPKPEKAPEQARKLRVPGRRCHLVLPEIGEARGQLV